MTTGQLIVVGVAILVASYVQILAGFGFALLSMPIMTLAVPVQQAVVVSTLLGMLSTTWQSWTLRKDADRVIARRLVIAAFLGMPLGLFLLDVVSDRALRIALGVAVLIATYLLFRQIALHHVGPVLDYGVGFVSGVLNTSLSTNGPPLVFGLQARQLPPEKFRGTINVVFAFSNVVGITLFALDGKFTWKGVTAAAIAVPAWLIGQAAAWPLRKHLSPDRFRAMVLGLLAVAGVTTIVFAVIR